MNFSIIDYLPSLAGGALIGAAASLLLFFSGRVMGVSTIVNRAFVERTSGDIAWRWYFIAGMIAGGVTLNFTNPLAFTGHLPTEQYTIVIAGLLVGLGTALGGGCTSGHGVCGISRLSIATITFILAGVLSVVLFKQLGVYL